MGEVELCRPPDSRDGFIQQTLPNPLIQHSDLEVLNLIVTIPALQNGESIAGCKLPAFIWIHGGGSWWAQTPGLSMITLGWSGLPLGRHSQ